MTTVVHIDKTATIADLPEDVYKGIYTAMFEALWAENFSQYSGAEKKVCFTTWSIDTIEQQYQLAMSKKAKSPLLKKQYKVINVSRNDNSQTLFRTQ